jgi:hypothetical protein
MWACQGEVDGWDAAARMTDDVEAVETHLLDERVDVGDHRVDGIPIRFCRRAGMTLAELVECDDPEVSRKRPEVQAPGIQRVERTVLAAVDQEQRFTAAGLEDAGADTPYIDVSQLRRIEFVEGQALHEPGRSSTRRLTSPEDLLRRPLNGGRIR